jgi:YbgC/YbaW family acyl-CoA thioester hydrolase
MPLSEFHYQRRVQFAETDASGIVHFSQFFRFAEEAEHAMWRAAGLAIEKEEADFAWPRVAASFEYRKPLYFEDEIDVHVRIAAKTAKTFRYACIIRRDGVIVAEGSHTTICVKKRRGEPPKAVDMPPDVAARFEVAPVEVRT